MAALTDPEYAEAVTSRLGGSPAPWRPGSTSRRACTRRRPLHAPAPEPAADAGGPGPGDRRRPGLDDDARSGRRARRQCSRERRRRAVPERRRSARKKPGGLGRGSASLEVVICCGSGGVGKTTVSAALGMAIAAAEDKRVLVLTVDPARRLATALGIKGIGAEPVGIPRRASSAPG